MGLCALIPREIDENFGRWVKEYYPWYLFFPFKLIIPQYHNLKGSKKNNKQTKNETKRKLNHSIWLL